MDLEDVVGRYCSTDREEHKVAFSRPETEPNRTHRAIPVAFCYTHDQKIAGAFEHYPRIVAALNETIRIMSEIDVVIEDHGGWPIR